jgi:hypothetical protein
MLAVHGKHGKLVLCFFTCKYASETRRKEDMSPNAIVEATTGVRLFAAFVVRTNMHTPNPHL